MSRNSHYEASAPICQSDTFRAQLTALAPTGLEFDARTFRELAGALVYVWLRGDQVLYVGMSRIGLGRPTSARHHRLRLEAVQDTDRMLVWPCAGEAAARALEHLLIRTLRPQLNQRVKHQDIAQFLGVQRLTAYRQARRARAAVTA